VSGGIYLVQGDGELVEMAEQDYASEGLLQELLAKHPNLLAGDQISSDDPRRWLLVAREVSLASEEDGSGRWSVDHLFLDQDAIPTIVEVKRSTDTRIRREVVGQMLDYAANAVVYWPVETLRARFQESRENQARDLSEFLGDPDADPDEFWQRVKTNLQAGKVRLIFVADEVPVELRCVVEFLNQQMSPAEVLAVEIKQYVGQEMKTLVPRLVGQTVEAQQKKSGGVQGSKQWDETSFFERLEKERGSVEADIARKILDWSRPRVTRMWWGKGKTEGSFVPVLNHKGVDHQLFAVWTRTGFEFYFQHYQRKTPFQSEQKRLELLDEVNTIPNVSLPTESISRRPSVPLSAFANETALTKLLTIFDQVIKEIKEY
jgi:hypothetical protein